ncbi:AT-hook motif nuclear-localized protein 17 [Camellia lanceoleosa]|uniref:AT-hook motif nuclear-localized protein 17 n=1 Tax=Camellia lanceoleosa TaxID=1840588 RepID=A0ACC0GRY5_9ERIC|nr:AT-hook motif nuclear-localized protein 17 [Camellia lanceoleosa]
MKGEFSEEKDHPNNMFAKLHQTQKFQQSLHPHHFQVIRECQNSEEADSRSPGAATTTPSAAMKEPNSDGATIEVIRRPRGRPPGSKNKPKPPIIITRDSTTEPPMTPYVLELPPGGDVVAAITRFCRNRNTGLCILTASGAVANVTLRQPTASPTGATVTFHGRFDILSLSATILPATTSFSNGFTISLAGPQGQIVGGAVVGPLMAAGTVYVIAASFNNPAFHRLPTAEDDVEGMSPTAVSGGGGGDDSGHPPAADMSMYSGQLASSDVIWTPTPRQPPPHY